MAVLVDTMLKSTIDKKMLRAFLYGVVHGEYKLYKDLSNSRLSLKFEDEADATSFKLKELDLQFNREFSGNNESEDDCESPFVAMTNFNEILTQLATKRKRKM